MTTLLTFVCLCPPLPPSPPPADNSGSSVPTIPSSPAISTHLSTILDAFLPLKERSARTIIVPLLKKGKARAGIHTSDPMGAVSWDQAMQAYDDTPFVREIAVMPLPEKSMMYMMGELDKAAYTWNNIIAGTGGLSMLDQAAASTSSADDGAFNGLLETDLQNFSLHIPCTTDTAGKLHAKMMENKIKLVTYHCSEQRVANKDMAGQHEQLAQIVRDIAKSVQRPDGLTKDPDFLTVHNVVSINHKAINDVHDTLPTTAFYDGMQEMRDEINNTVDKLEGTKAALLLAAPSSNAGPAFTAMPFEVNSSAGMSIAPAQGLKCQAGSEFGPHKCQHTDKAVSYLDVTHGPVAKGNLDDLTRTAIGLVVQAAVTHIRTDSRLHSICCAIDMFTTLKAAIRAVCSKAGKHHTRVWDCTNGDLLQHIAKTIRAWSAQVSSFHVSQPHKHTGNLGAQKVALGATFTNDDLV
ncbi:hypothetical protein B0H13DRAFT_1930249 [Mycena leptocephala]|nr:hypothetical protein B0H13DRAFT_1930249 [Mycena leptocephala]